MLLGCMACSITKNSSYNPDMTMLNLTMDDMEYLGETEISVEYRTYIGVIRVIDKVNGERYDSSNRETAVLSGGSRFSESPYSVLSKAAPKVLKEYPDADYVVVASQTKHTVRLFLGSEVTMKAVVKAYSLK